MQSIGLYSPLAASLRRLSARALRLFTHTLPAFYAETDLRHLPGAIADAVATLIPGESHGVVLHDRIRGERSWALRPASSDHEWLVPVFFENFHEFTPAAHRKATGSGEALALSDFVSRGSRDRLAIFREYYDRIGIADDLSINVTHGGVTACVAVLRSRPGFRGEERELFNALRPHIQQAWGTAKAIADLRTRTAATPVEARVWEPEPLERKFGLTPREAEVLMWVAQGKTNPEVAQILAIQPYTVRTHLERVFAKLGVETRHAAGLRAIELLGVPA
ncbi:MAG TPA: helix-turn-helix transcriptional regulator [Opitutaceae bacterium]